MWATVIKQATTSLAGFLTDKFLGPILKKFIENVKKAAKKRRAKKEAQQSVQELRDAETPNDRLDRFNDLK
jgi:p-aminobenzoyl-glutamate transporter AbgT